MASFKTSYLFDKLLTDETTSKMLKEAVEKIMRDGKIDMYDIPEILLIITTIIANNVTVKLTAEDLSDLIKQIYKFIEKQYNLIPDETQKESFNRLIDSCIKLILVQPKVNKAVGYCLGKINTCCK
jgi:hypothetical protein